MGRDSRVIKNERKYNLIRPFWLVKAFEINMCKEDMDLGRVFSNQKRSKRLRAVL